MHLKNIFNIFKTNYVKTSFKRLTELKQLSIKNIPKYSYLAKKTVYLKLYCLFDSLTSKQIIFNVVNLLNAIRKDKDRKKSKKPYVLFK